jgi:hypothetical protein
MAIVSWRRQQRNKIYVGLLLIAVATIQPRAHSQSTPSAAPIRLPPLASSEPTTAPATSATPASSTATPIQLATWDSIQQVAFDDSEKPAFEIGAQFNKGVFIRSTNLEENPYSLYIGGRLQLRHVHFSPNEATWTDNTGATRPIRRRNYIDTERARINVSGHAISPNLTYQFILDGDGDDGATVDMLFYHFEYQFCDKAKVRLGRNKVSSSREWLLSSRYLTLVDRSMATEFFRPALSDGIWLIGEPTEQTYYEISITNGLRSSRRRTIDLDNDLAFAASGTWEPWGSYGNNPTDFDFHTEPVVRFGSSASYGKSGSRDDVGLPLGDEDFVRLSDGTPLATLGALAPGVQLLGDTYYQLSFDAGWKHRGWSLSTEYYMRWLQDFVADGPIPHTKLYTYGFVVEGGKFWIPGRFDSIVRMSQVSGFYGNGFEYSTGCNWYFGAKGDEVNKFTIDISHIIGSPVNSSLADILVGDDGLLLRTQVQIGF